MQNEGMMDGDKQYIYVNNHIII